MSVKLCHSTFVTLHGVMVLINTSLGRSQCDLVDVCRCAWTARSSECSLPPPIMQSALGLALTVLQSSDHASLISAYVSIYDLATLSALNRSLHRVFDSDAVWQGS